MVLGDTPLKTNPVHHGLVTRGALLGHQMPRRNGGGVTPLVRVPDTLPQPLQAETVNQFLGSLRTRRDKAMLLLMLLGGLRKSEVIVLNLEDLDFARRAVLIREGKGGHQRVASVAPSALTTLLHYLNEERPRTSSTRVFLVLKGLPDRSAFDLGALDNIIKYHRRQKIFGSPPDSLHFLVFRDGELQTVAVAPGLSAIVSEVADCQPGLLLRRLFPKLQRHVSNKEACLLVGYILTLLRLDYSGVGNSTNPFLNGLLNVFSYFLPPDIICLIFQYLVHVGLRLETVPGAVVMKKETFLAKTLEPRLCRDTVQPRHQTGL
jgi:hypothetical protein